MGLLTALRGFMTADLLPCLAHTFHPGLLGRSSDAWGVGGGRVEEEGGGGSTAATGGAAPRLALRMVGPTRTFLSVPDDAVCADGLLMANFMREWGSRLANAEKNTGSDCFAFNTFQRSFFPVEYRCPLSVLGHSET